MPLVFLILFAFILAGGAFHAPNNHDFLAYRFSRILHWLAECSWHWIDTANSRMNYSGMGFEWLALPLFSFTGSNRYFFLINVLAYALIPGLFFSVLRDLGLGRRLSWYWMWIVPAAYCYVMQAGSTGNDAYGAVFLLASIHFFSRAAKPGHLRDFWWGLVAAALLTEIKLVNLPLLLPCLVAGFPAMKSALRRPWLLLFFGMFSLAISGVPSLMANTVYTGHWSGDPFNLDKMQVHNPVAAYLGNSLQLAGQSLVPPFFPSEGRLSQHLVEQLPLSWVTLLQRDFPRFYLGITELPQEESVGIGLGLSVLLLVSLSAILWKRGRDGKGSGAWFRRGKWICLGAWGAFLFYMGKMGSECTGRLLCSYYPLLIASLLSFSGWEGLTRKRWWRSLAVLAMCSSLVPLLLTPSRPLGPTHGILDWAGNHVLDFGQFTRAKQVYEVYERREDVLAPVRMTLPEDARVIGFLAGGDDIEISLWKPFGKRFVVSPMDPKQYPEWMVLNQEGVRRRGFDSVEAWMAALKYDVVAQIPVVTKVREGVVLWTVARAKSHVPWRNPLDTPRMPGWAAILALGLAFGCSHFFGKSLLMEAGKAENLVVLGCFQGWIFWSAGMVTSGWILSAYESLSWMGACAVALGTFVLLQLRLYWIHAPFTDRKEFLEWLGYWPWLGLTILILLASALYSPVTLDSLAYRIPRMLFWMQEGGLAYIPSCDSRLNYMTPNWEWVSMPLFLTGCDRLLRVPGILSWCLIYLIFCVWGKRLAPDRVKSCAFLCVASTICVLQAASSVNDLFAAVLMLLSSVFIVRYEYSPKTESVVLSALSLALAAGTKPHFAVMALPWIFWFFLSPARPLWQVLKWKKLWALPVILICSPLPTFLLNKLYYGSWKGEPEDSFVSGSHWLANITLGSIMMLWQMIQPPLHPLYDLQNSLTEDWIAYFGLREWVPRFALESKAVGIVDRASFGLVATLILISGLWMFFRGKGIWKKWPFLMGGAGLFGFFMALSQVVPWTVGRSFSGFVFLLFPAALAGLARLSNRTIWFWTAAAFLSCAFSVIFSVSHPLWPARTIADWVGKKAPDTVFERMLRQSADFSTRSDTASDLVRQIPENEDRILALVAVDRPMLELWKPYSFHRKVITFDKTVTPQEIVAQQGRYLLTSPGLEDYYPGLMAGLEKTGAFRKVASREYISAIRRGPEVWTLWEKIVPDAGDQKAR